MTSLLTAAALLAVVHTPGEAATVAKHVVVISIDGLPAYLLDDPRASLPVIRELRAKGASAREGMHTSNPSVTWPNHTTLMSGVHPERHGVLFNGLPVRDGPGQPVRVLPSKAQADLVRVPLIFDTFKQAGLTTAAINWPCTRDSASIDDNFPDVPNQLRYTTPRLKEELSADGLIARFEQGGVVIRDEVWTEAACRVIRERKPSLVALHLLNLDSTHHTYGPQTPPGYTTAALMDALVGRVLDAIDDAGIRDETAVFIVSDHGFISVNKTLRPNAILRREGLLTVEGNDIVSARVHVVPEGGIGMVYLTDPSTADEDRAAVRRLFEGQEGVAAVLDTGDFARYHLPLPTDSNHPGMADMILAAKEGYAVVSSPAGDAFVVDNPSTTGSHGYLSTEPKMNATFVAAGAGIKPGVTLDAIENVDIAPTVAQLLGVRLDRVTGRVLTEVLEDNQ